MKKNNLNKITKEVYNNKLNPHTTTNPKNSSCDITPEQLTVNFANTTLGQASPIQDSCNIGLSYFQGYNFMNKCPPNGEFVETVGGSCDTYLNVNANGGIKPQLYFKAAWNTFTPPFITTKPSIGGYLNPTMKFDASDGYVSKCNTQAPASFDINFSGADYSFGNTNIYDPLKGQIDFSIGGEVDINAGVSIPIPSSVGQNYQTNCQRISYTAPPLYSCITEISPVSGTTNVYNVEDSAGNGTGGNFTYRTASMRDDPIYLPSNNSCNSVMANFCSNPTMVSGQHPQLDNTNFSQWGPTGVCTTYTTNYSNDSGSETTIGASLTAINKKWPIQSINAPGVAWQNNPEAVTAWTGILSAIKKNKSTSGSYGLDNVCSVVTRDSIKNLNSSNLLYQACACHLPADQYSSFLGIIDQGYFHVCDPVCSVAAAKGEVIGQYVDGEEQVCEQNNCIIDNTSINIINSSNGNITFDQICGKTGSNSGSANCYFKDLNVFEQASSVGNINIGQNCQACYSGHTQIDCNTGEALTWWGRVKQFFTRRNTIITIVVIIVIIILVVVLLILNSKTAAASYALAIAERQQEISQLKNK